MDFKDLVKFIKAQGCKVYLYKKSKTIEGAYGYFVDAPKPTIKMALKGLSKKRKTSVLLHEYAHFLQWRDGFSQYLDGICWAQQMFDDWVCGYLELNKREIKMIRNTMLFIEYDADMRALELSNLMNIKSWDSDFHLRDSQSYIGAIKWGWDKRSDWKKRVSYKYWPAKKMSHKKLFAPLTSKEKKILRKMKKF